MNDTHIHTSTHRETDGYNNILNNRTKITHTHQQIQIKLMEKEKE